jgi:hypothetical protein
VLAHDHEYRVRGRLTIVLHCGISIESKVRVVFERWNWKNE